MKKSVVLFLVNFILASCFAQRYLHPVFSNASTTHNIVYGNAPNYQGSLEDLKLDFYEPTGDAESKRPLIIYMHGGGFTDVNQTKTLVHIVAFCDSFARRGYAVASIDYRLDTSISNRAIMNAMHDARAAIRFFKANASTYKIDTSNIFMGGESAGAVSSLNVNYIHQTSELQYPSVTPYSTVGTIEGNSGNPGFFSKTKATLCFCGGTKTVFLDPLFDTTTIQSPLEPPLLMVHGTSDPIIPVQYGLEVALRATRVGLPTLFYSLYGATHCPWFNSLPNSWDYLDTLVNYTSTFLYAVINSPTAIYNATEKKEGFKVYPNPAKDELHLVFQNEQKQIELTIYNLMGKTVLSERIEKSAELVSLDIHNLPPGIYFIHATTEGQTWYSQKIIIAKE